MFQSHTLANVQAPIIPIISACIRSTPGTLSLGQGMVGYPPPASALEAIRNFGIQQEDHWYGAALGTERLLALITAKLQAENTIDCSKGYRVMVTAGSNMAFLNILQAITDPGDEVILPLPYYFNQEMAIRMLNRTPVLVPTDGQYQLQLELLRAAITPKTRAIVTVSPNNPTGAVYPEAALRAVNALCKEHQLYHISDEAYEYFIYDQASHFSPGSIAHAEQHTISLYSLSKAYGFAGWRIGYIVFPEVLLPGMLKIQDTNLICPPLINQQAAIGALETGVAYCQKQLQPLASIREQVNTELKTLSDICEITLTEGGFYSFLKLHKPQDDLALAKQLINEYKIAVIPGRAFGLTDACYLRVSYGMLREDTVTEALRRLVTGIRALCKN